VPVEVSVRFGSVTLTSAEIVGLREGDVLPLHHRVEEPLTLTAVGQPMLRATPGKRGKRLAVMIVDPVRTNA
jgi:flagellar motor switch protein FliM